MKSFELMPTKQKSYGRKAFVLQDDKENVFLQSYDTIVCGIVNGAFVRYWGGYSATTQKHIGDSLMLYGFHAIGKKEWEGMAVSSCPVASYEKVATKQGSYCLGYNAL